jgi:asparagine synthase (glutamine-hydrolysing)
MSGIAGIAAGGKRAEVERMLDQMAHRGRAGRQILEMPVATVGLVWTEAQGGTTAEKLAQGIVADRASDSRYACAEVVGDRLVLERDPLGVAPLYWGYNGEGQFCFASEVKGLLEVTRDVQEFPPGHSYQGGQFKRYFELQERPYLEGEPDHMAAMLRQRLDAAVDRRLVTPDVGVWLSGGIDSSALAALARGLVPVLHTFTAGLAGAPDLRHARTVADYLKTEHHEIVATLDGLLAILPNVIYALESFDAFVIRSGLLNWIAGREAANYVVAVLSGEAGDELLLGHPYLHNVEAEDLGKELLDIVGRLHNTALQRADRCAAAHGIVAYVPFTAATVVDYSLGVPPEYKRREGLGKWILRHAVADCLPEGVLERKHAKLWEGGGLADLLPAHAASRVSDRDFQRERELANGVTLRTKEELLYYRIFKEHFGDFEDLSWMGRTKWAPVAD